MKRAVLLCLGLLGVALLAGCAAGANPNTATPDAVGKVAGFWQGLWHGLIVFITFIVSLFNDSVSVYEVHNNGGWYNFGFVLGAMSAFGGGSRAAK
ncbi:hypothetical protein FJZ36_09100 [Candidatus Poribacteria bacterium]|nr:hypothetical protein [Candidatus Poribacteria bacterium]